MTFDRTRDFAHEVAKDLVASRDDVVANMRKSQRNERVFIDWSQNSTHKTTVCAYSLRGREQATVSAPLAWDEVTAARDEKDPAALLHTTDETLNRVERDGDLFADVLTAEQTLPR
jgi:bifunctional non-homologous end joining protein LigD